MSESELYFGYGSNLDSDDWVSWCEDRGVDPSGMEEVGAAFLLGHEMKFHYYSNGRKGGAADVVDIGTESEVPGVLFTLNDEAWKAMDRKEGHPNYYERKLVTVRTTNGEINAITYTVVEGKIRPLYVPPTDEYVALIRSGLERRNLPTTALEKALH